MCLVFVAFPRGVIGLSAVCDFLIILILDMRRLCLISHVTHIKHVFFHLGVYLF